MQAHYLTESRSAAELAELEELMGWGVTQVRVPYLTTTDDAGTVGIEEQRRAPMLALKAAGILTEYGKQVALIGCVSVHVNTLFVESIARLTGCYPYLVQSAAVLAALDIGGSLRVLNLDGAMRG